MEHGLRVRLSEGTRLSEGVRPGGHLWVFLGLLGLPGMEHTSPKMCGITTMHSHAVVGVNMMVVVVDGQW